MLAPPPIPSWIRKVPVPYHTSILSGQQWVSELLDGHPGRIRCELGMHHPSGKCVLLYRSSLVYIEL
ncbi:hypothetical protein BU15DRAFT_56046 [Melanogaster broomeanus]|nr:hypothetical protein BU15DRAFT_56046 [Melanogaster broomeanus]